MKRLIVNALPLLLLVSCDNVGDFRDEYLSKLNVTDKIEITSINDGEKKSIVFTDNESLAFFREILRPINLESRKTMDDKKFPIDIFLYLDDKVIGEMGIEFGHIQYIHYKGTETFDFKAVLNDRMEELMDVINKTYNDK